MVLLLMSHLCLNSALVPKIHFKTLKWDGVGRFRFVRGQERGGTDINHPDGVYIRNKYVCLRIYIHRCTWPDIRTWEQNNLAPGYIWFLNSTQHRKSLYDMHVSLPFCKAGKEPVAQHFCQQKCSKTPWKRVQETHNCSVTYLTAYIATKAYDLSSESNTQ